LKPNNKGWQVLRKIGWDESGGLGRSDTMLKEQGLEERLAVGQPVGGRVKRESGGAKGNAKDTVIDLTLDSASDSDSDSDLDRSPTDNVAACEKFGQDIIAAHNAATASVNPSSSRTHASGSGAGRTAPVATYFKTDMRGIGAISLAEQRRNLLRPSSLSAATPDSSSSRTSSSATAGKRKRVTHTNEEIRALAAERKGTGEGLIGQDKVAFDMKKAKRDVRVDREERQRWREIINM